MGSSRGTESRFVGPAVGEKKRLVWDGVEDGTGPLVDLRTPRPEVIFCDESWSLYL